MAETKRRRDYPQQTLEAQQARVQLAVALYKGGLNLRQIAVRLNITHQAVHRILQRSGVELRARGGNQGGHSRHAK